MSALLGKFVWMDLTVPDAEAIRDFYAEVAGWRPEPVSMDGYEDYNMLPPGSSTPVAGVCHARGINADIPPVWMLYVAVPNLKHSVRRCLALGGKVIAGPKGPPGNQFIIIQDPAGATLALYEQA